MPTLRRTRTSLLLAAFATTGLFAAVAPAQASIKPCEIHHCTPIAYSGLGSASPTPKAANGITPCTIDHCDTLYEYYSDATYTVRVGEYQDGPCGYLDSGVHTQYVRTFRRTC